MTIIKYLQLPFYFDEKRMKEDLRAIESSPWMPHYQTKHYEGEWSAIPLRSINGEAGNIIVSPTGDAEYRDTAWLQESVYFKEILSTFQCPLMAVRLLKLDAGAIIKEHRDAELNFEKGEVRIHIPVVTHEDVAFYLDGERINFKEGECWYMNVNLKHRVDNMSTVNRVHLVIDAVVNDWVKEIFSGDGVINKKEIEESALYDDETKKQMIASFRHMNTEVANEMADTLEKELKG